SVTGYAQPDEYPTTGQAPRGGGGLTVGTQVSQARSSGGQPPAEAIHVENLHKKFGELHVLKGVSLSARDGEVVAIIGGSGSGKSTLLRCINCLENPTRGI